MKNIMTIAQFAKMHNVNKRTLHYYDQIGLFSPAFKADNQYRYYNHHQSIDFEYINLLKDLNMTLDEIKQYLDKPSRQEFAKIIDNKLGLIDEQIKHYQAMQTLLLMKKQQIEMANDQSNYDIKIVEMHQQIYKYLPYTFEDDNLLEIFEYIKQQWGIQQCKNPIGSCISVDNILKGNFNDYHGLFTTNNSADDKNIVIQPSGKYLQLLVKDSWDHMDVAYQRIIKYADDNGLQLEHMAFETSLNDFVTDNTSEYVTQIIVKIKDVI